MIEYRNALKVGKADSISMVLPISWVREQGIEKGQLLKVVSKGPGLLITKANVE